MKVVFSYDSEMPYVRATVRCDKGNTVASKLFRRHDSLEENAADADRWSACEMSSREFTPGPWSAEWTHPEDMPGGKDDGYSICATQWHDGYGHGRQLAIVQGLEGRPDCASAAANARLIAAAPEMFDIIRHLESGDPVSREWAREVADKVRGVVADDDGDKLDEPSVVA